MDLEWSTFLFEIVNFLVLVWILQRFLYKPVLGVIDRRRQGIEKTLVEAETRRGEATALQEQYRNRLDAWEEEKQKAFLQLQAEMEAERQHRLEAVRHEIGQEREKARVAEQRRLEELARHAEEDALALGARFAARLLERLATPALEGSLVGALVEDLSALPPAERQALREALERDGGARVASAHPLSEGQRREIAAAIAWVAEREVTCHYVEDRSLRAGVRLTLGDWTLRANLADELQFFREVADGGDRIASSR